MAIVKINTNPLKVVTVNSGDDLYPRSLKVVVPLPGARVINIKGLFPTEANDLIGRQNLISGVAGEDISGGKAVIIGSDEKVYVFNPNNENHYGKLCGVAKQAALQGNPLDICISGELTE